MRVPIKLNRASWPRILAHWLPSADDPRPLAGGIADEAVFSRLVSTFKFGSTFKSTQPRRFPLAVAELEQLAFSHLPVIVDVAASDGVTSIDVIRRLRYRKYYVTDLNLEVRCSQSRGITYYYDPAGECILAVDDLWIVYADTNKALFPLGWMAGRRIKAAPRLSPQDPTISLVSPALLLGGQEGVVVTRYDIFDRWPNEKADLVLAANILNRAYFSDEQILSAFGNFLQALAPGGRVAVIENRENEQATIFLFDGRTVVVERKVREGCEIERMVLARYGGGKV